MVMAVLPSPALSLLPDADNKSKAKKPQPDLFR
jgi:hypothetical protein